MKTKHSPENIARQWEAYPALLYTEKRSTTTRSEAPGGHRFPGLDGVKVARLKCTLNLVVPEIFVPLPGCKGCSRREATFSLKEGFYTSTQNLRERTMRTLTSIV